MDFGAGDLATATLSGGASPILNAGMGGLPGQIVSQIPGVPAPKGSFMGGITGTAGGVAGTGMNAPQLANIQQVINPQQLQQGQTGVNNALASQNALLAALQGQGGIQRQTNISDQQQALLNALAGQGGVQNQMGAMNQQQALNAQLANANGIGTQNAAISGLQNIAGQQQAAANMYGQIASGQGPNPAQAMLNQATGQNVANQAALMAGQRGAAANVGLMARQLGQQGANLQQQAAGQQAVMQANQQLGALQGLTAQQQAMAGTQQAIGGFGTTQAGMQQAGITNQSQMAAQQIAQQQAQQQAAAQQANQMAGQQIGATQTGLQANLTNAGQLQNAAGAQNQANVAAQGNVNTANAGLAQTQLEGQQGLIGGILQGAGAGAGMAKAKGGLIKKYADGGGPVMAPAVAVPVAPMVPQQQSVQPSGLSSGFGQFLKGWGAGMTGSNMGEDGESSSPQMRSGSQKLQKGSYDATKALFSKNKEDAEEGQAVAGPDLKNAVGAAMVGAQGGLASTGGHVNARSPSQKAVKSGNSYDNDKVPAMLSEGEIVLPRSVTMSKNPAAEAAKFVHKTLAKKRS